MHSTRLLARHTPRNSSRTRPANSCQWGSAFARSLSEKQVKVDKDLRRAAAERFFFFRGIPHFVPGGEIHKSLLEFGLILGQPPSSPLVIVSKEQIVGRAWARYYPFWERCLL